MSRKRINFKYRKERALLSDVLPYEVPITFTNRHFYDFLLTHHIEYKDGNISWKTGDKALDTIVHLIFGLPENRNRFSSENRYIGIQKTKFNIYTFARLNNGTSPFPSLALIPFGYKINHKQSEFRELTVPHPRSQIDIVNFYDTCKEVILYYCSQSSFSIRKPAKIAKYKFHKDRTHYEQLADDLPIIEEQNKEYENLRSFFVYKNYSNIYKFYESYQFHKCEKKYNKLLKVDISKCFDSIYTHSLSWAILGRSVVKENLGASNKTFSGRFDKLMQNMNYNETNGIIIGPEFSRIFAELILQSVDRKLEHDLLNTPLMHKIDYEIFRYVDDCFVFYNEEYEKDAIVDALQHALKEYKLHLNAAKAIVYEKPIITEISRAKQRIAYLLEEKLTYKLETCDGDDGESDIIKGSIYINSNRLITGFKTIIKECNVEYKNMLNYSLATTENKCDRILKKYNKADSAYSSQKQLIQSITSILEFVFFIYSVSPRVNTTIRLCRILRIFCSFLKSTSVSGEDKHLIYKYMYDNICFILKKNKSSEHTQVETLYLLTMLPELGKDYWLEPEILADYFGINKLNANGSYHGSAELNYFSFTVILFYMRDKVRYRELRKFIEKSIEISFSKKSVTLQKDAEAVMLFFDVISCPFVSEQTKINLLGKYGVTDSASQEGILNFRNRSNSKQLWFTTWENFNFGKELDTKHSQEVY